ncbi:MAG: hypothetical protein H0V07_04785 [Propionibacteriales bacterium]|nr:hypothetical protein [Propionibacteriales bacterium]
MAKTYARKKLGSAGDDARSAVTAAESAMDKIGSATQDALTAVAASVGPALTEARDAIVETRDRIGPLVEDAKDRIAPVVDDARDRITPVVDDAKERFTPAVENARSKIVPAAGLAVAAGRRGGRRAAVRLRLADEPKQSHKVRNLLIILGLGGVAAFVYTRLTGKDADPAWTASRDHAAAPRASTSQAPPFTPSEPVAAPPLAGDVSDEDQSDTAPTAPFPSEETVESHTPTTPDKPLEQKDL